MSPQSFGRATANRCFLIFLSVSVISQLWNLESSRYLHTRRFYEEQFFGRRLLLIRLLLLAKLDGSGRLMNDHSPSTPRSYFVSTSI